MLVGPTTRRRRLGTDLRRLRESKSLKLEDVAVVLGVAPSTLSRIETGKMPTRTSYLMVMLDLYGVADPQVRSGLIDLAREGQRRGWWAAVADLLPPGYGMYLDLEAEASQVRAFQALLVHGLVRTPHYASAVIAAERPELTSQQAGLLGSVEALRAQALGAAGAARLHLILDESVLLRSVGSAPVMKRQLEHLLAVARQPNVTIQVLRLSAPSRPVLTGTFGILSFADPDGAEVLCADGLRGQVILEERAADVRAMAGAFDILSDTACSPDESGDLLADLAARSSAGRAG